MRTSSKIGAVAGLLVWTTACFDEHYEQMLTTVRWDPEAKTLHYEIRFDNVGAGFLDCETVEDCLEVTKEPDYFDLAELEAQDIVQTWVRDGNTLDLVITATSPDRGSEFAGALGIVIERGGRLGKERDRLAIVDTEVGRPIDLKKAEHRTWTRVMDNEAVEHESWTLHHKTRVVTMRDTPETPEAYEPIFEELPGLAAAMGL